MIDTANSNGTACGAVAIVDGPSAGTDELVISALESDCIECRNVYGVGPPEQRGCAVRETLNYEPGAMLVDADGKVIGRDKL
jgi:hypothetical protein